MMKKIISFTIMLFLTGINLQAQDVLFVSGSIPMIVESGADVYLNGGLFLNNNSSFTNNGVVTIARNGAGTADLTDNTTNPYNYGTGKFVFTGTGTQNVTSINQFERLDVDNAGLNLLSNINANTWFLKKGTVNTGSFIAVATSASPLSVQSHASNLGFKNSWFNGYLRRYITPSTVDAYKFPVGNSVQVNIAEMDNLNETPLTAVNYITASFGPKPGNDAGINVSENGTPYQSVNTAGVWYLVPDATPTSGVYELKLFFNGFTGLTDNSFGILRRPDASSTAVDWIVPTGSALPTAGSPGRTVADGYADRTKMTTFSQFGIGSTIGALPLQLLSFNAVKKDKTVLLQWVTTNEINTSHFELYKAGQPSALQYLDKVMAAGNSTTDHSYNYIDQNPLQGLNFYQLKMVDKNGNYKMSQVVKVNFDNDASFNIYPNPVTNNTFFIAHSSGKIKEIRLIATDGKQVLCNFTVQSNTVAKITVPPTLAKGNYVVQVNTDEGIKNTMIVIQ